VQRKKQEADRQKARAFMEARLETKPKGAQDLLAFTKEVHKLQIIELNVK